MKPLSHLPAVIVILISTFSRSAFCADQITLQLNKSDTQAQIALHSQMVLPVSGMYPEYVIQQSSNLVDWTTAAASVSGGVGVRMNFFGSLSRLLVINCFIVPSPM